MVDEDRGDFSMPTTHNRSKEKSVYDEKKL